MEAANGTPRGQERHSNCSPLRGYGYAFLTMICWASTPTVAKLSMATVNGVAATFYANLFAFPLLLLALRWKGGIEGSASILVDRGSDESITGTKTFTSIVATSADINGGTVDGANVTVGAGKTLDVSAGTLPS